MSRGWRPFEWLLERRTLAWFLAVVLAALGGWTAQKLPSGIYPEVEFPRVVVVARSGDAPPELTQLALTRPLEGALATVLGVERVRSRTIRGAMELSLNFAPGTDMWRALQLVSARVAEIRSSLPQGAEVTVERLSTTSFPVVTFNLTGQLDPRRLRELAEFVIKPAFSRVRGVGRVEVLGGDVREIEIVLDPERAVGLRLSPVSVAETVRSQAVLQAVGRLEQGHSAVTVMASSEPSTLDELRALPVAVGPSGGPIPLSAVADVFEGAEDRLLRVSGPGGETVLLSVARLPGASTPEVVRQVQATAAELSRSLPPGVALAPVYDQALLVNESIASVRDAILIGVALCVVVIALFLRDLRGGLAAALSVPLTLGATFLPLGPLGQTLNLMSLGGLAVAIGLVIDDAIVVVEGISRRLDAGDTPVNASGEALRSLLAPLLGTTATTIVVFVPLARLEGVVGRFFSALAATLTIAVVVSLVMSLSIVPLAAARWLRRRAPRPARPSRFRPTLAWMLDRAWLAALAVCGLFALGALAVTHVPSGFLPTMDEGAFVLDYFLPAGTSLTDTDTAARRIELVLSQTPEVATYSRRTGAELGPAAATQVNRGDIMVRLKARRSRSAEQIIALVRARLGREVPGVRTEFVQVLQDVINDLAGNPRPLELKLLGDDYAVLREKAALVAARVRDVPGLVDLYEGVEGQAPELRLRIDGVAAAKVGKTAADVAAELDAALHGVIATIVRRPQRPIGVRVRYPDWARFDAERIAGLPVLFGSGGITPISALAASEPREAQSVLVRESLRPAVILSADHEGRDLGSMVRDVRARLEGLELPEGYQLEFGGQYESQEETFAALGEVMGFGLLAVLGVLLAQFRKARLALLVLLTVPLSVVGALVTLWIVQVPLNASSLMGCVLLVGLVVKNGILLLERFEALVGAGAEERSALLDAADSRGRPILMTTLATIAGLLPLAAGFGSGAELQRPLAVAVIGGLAVATTLSLFALPSLVYLTRSRA